MRTSRLRRNIQNMGFLFNYHKPSRKPNVFIFSMPRSGSTWLMELIWTQPDFKYCNEPLNLKGTFLQNKSDIAGFPELYTMAALPKLLKYFKGFTSGKSGYLNPSPFRKYYRLSTSRIVFKIIHGGELFINQVADGCNGRVIYLIRNPIDVALSRKQLPRLRELTGNEVLSIFTNSQKKLISDRLANGSALEKRVVAWCIQNRLALENEHSKWLLISYEELVLNPKLIIRKIFTHCELNDIDVMYKQLNSPSAVTAQSSEQDVDLMQNDSDKLREKLVNKWKNKVEKEDANKCFEICDKLDFGIYNYETLTPNWSRLGA